ncbi:Hypothetical predicted protein, partial [Paramuricea clavata]
MDDKLSRSPIYTGLKDASGKSILAFGKTFVNVPIDGSLIPFEATLCDVIRPILGRDFFEGPGRNLLLDIGGSKIVKKPNNSYPGFSVNFKDSKIVCSLVVPTLNPYATSFCPSAALSTCKLQARQLVDNFMVTVGKDDGNSPCLFAPIRIETGDKAP